MMDYRELVVVGDDVTSAGFRLAGLRSYTISDDSKERVYEELKDGKAVLILTKLASDMLGEKTEKLREKNIVLVVPEKKGEEYAAIRELIKKTVGFDLEKSRRT